MRAASHRLVRFAFVRNKTSALGRHLVARVATLLTDRSISLSMSKLLSTFVDTHAPTRRSKPAAPQPAAPKDKLSAEDRKTAEAYRLHRLTSRKDGPKLPIQRRMQSGSR